MSLKIFVAGCLPKDRSRIEDLVKQAFGHRSETGPWRVSLVRMGSSWSINLDGPEPPFKAMSLTAPEDRLKDTISDALAGGVRAVKAALSGPKRPSWRAEGGDEARAEEEARTKKEDTQDRYECPSCKQPFRVVYAARPHEPKKKAPVACPRCWHVTQVSVSESAAVTEEYRAETISS